MDIKVPSLAEGITSGTVVSILVEVGESVSKDQTLVELETEKAIAPLPATADGVVATISVAEGDSVSVGQTIITLDSKEGASENKADTEKESDRAEVQSAPQPSAQRSTPARQPADTTQGSSAILEEAKNVPSGFPPPASPSIRKLAAELGLDLYRVQGSGSGGRIDMEDLRAYVAELQRIALSPKTAATQATAASKNIEPLPDFSRFGDVRTESMSLLRKKISEKMSASWEQVVHVNQFDEAQVDNILELRAKHKEAYASKGKRLTVTALLIKALANTLKDHPVFNAAIDTVNETIIYKEYVNIGLAVDTPQGLIVPVIKGADTLSMAELAEQIDTLATKARERSIALEDLQGASFTVSNQGGIGGYHFTPIVNVPEVAILGLGQSRKRPVVKDDKIVVGTVMPLVLSYDHRLIDGGNAARFISDLVAAIENFDEKELN